MYVQFLTTTSKLTPILVSNSDISIFIFHSNYKQELMLIRSLEELHNYVTLGTFPSAEQFLLSTGKPIFLFTSEFTEPVDRLCDLLKFPTTVIPKDELRDTLNNLTGSRDGVHFDDGLTEGVFYPGGVNGEETPLLITSFHGPAYTTIDSVSHIPLVIGCINKRALELVRRYGKVHVLNLTKGTPKTAMRAFLQTCYKVNYPYYDQLCIWSKQDEESDRSVA